jgi:hypothetical protein
VNDDAMELQLLREAVADDAVAFVLADWYEEHGRAADARRARHARGLVRRVDLSPAYDRRHAEPSKNYGVHGVDLRMTLIGPAGAVTFTLFTGWHLPHVAQGVEARGDRALAVLLRPQPAGVDYHSPVPRHEGQTVRPDCGYLGGRPCYSDGSSLAAGDVFNRLLTGGHEAVWAYLEDYYHHWLADAPDNDRDHNDAHDAGGDHG